MTSCGERDSVRLRLTAAERARIDTLYTAKIDSIRPYLDSLCEANFASELEVAVDSIIQQRKLEEERLRARYEQTQ